MTAVRYKTIPLPAAVLALSVAVCLGAAAPAEAASYRSSAQADQRETIEHLIGAIQQAAKKLTDQLTGQAAAFDRSSDVPAACSQVLNSQPIGDLVPTVLSLREALLNLPPPVC
ncbi:MAG: hypothetical protein AB8C95_07930 [Phycisphaeraceae bacterium]